MSRKRASLADDEVVAFLREWLPRLGLRWRGFRKVRGQVRKRLGRRLMELGLTDLEAYAGRLEHDADERCELIRMARITISRFWRDRELFEVLGDEILPRAAALARAEHRPVRALSLGCASGEEPYSVAIAWTQGAAAESAVELRVVAADADVHLLVRARRATYDRGSLRDLPSQHVDGLFTGDDQLTLDEGIRCLVSPVALDVRDGLPPGPFDLVLCRNLVFTYLAVSEQLRIAAAIAERLTPGGELVVGAHESLPEDAGWVRSGRCRCVPRAAGEHDACGVQRAVHKPP